MSYPKPNNTKITSLRKFLDLEMHKLLPNQDIIIMNHLNLIKYLDTNPPLYVIRKFRNHDKRGSIYSFNNNKFTVTDNEPALWVFLETFKEIRLSFSELYKNNTFPIAFALKSDEAKNNIWLTIGRKHKDFSENGWKHCHIFQCSPKGETITDEENLKLRNLRLLSPINHFPFFSPNKYSMPLDYGENKECIDYVIWWLYNHFYAETNKIHFEDFVKKQNYSIPHKEPNDIKIEYYPLKGKNNIDITFEKLNLPTKKNYSKSKKIHSEISKEITSFRIVKKWYGEGFKIKVMFNNGRKFEYFHDEVYENVIKHFENLDCWKNYGYYSSSTNIPNVAKAFVTEF